MNARGLTTSPIPYEAGLLELEFDLREDLLRLRTSDDRSGTMRLRPMSVADFYHEAMELLATAGVEVRIWPVPTEVVDAIPFEEDTAAGGYEREHAKAFHGALIDAERVLTRFRGRYRGKASPVHLFWGGFDLATTRFSGRPAPRHPGGVSNCPDWVMEEAYANEVSSAGWWPGSGDLGPSFYSYMYPEPAGFSATSLEPARGTYHAGFGEFVLPYAEATATGDPDATVMAFLEATYAAGARLADWDSARPDAHAPATDGAVPRRHHRT